MTPEECGILSGDRTILRLSIVEFSSKDITVRLFGRRRSPAQAAPPAGRRFGFGLSPYLKRTLTILAIVVVLFVLALVTAPFWINWLWFGSVGYRSVIITNYTAQAASFVASAVLCGALFWVNIRFALRNTRIHAENQAGRISAMVIRVLATLGTTIVAIFAGVIAQRHWQDVLLAVHGGSFGIEDPTFHRDAGFYIFLLPVLRGVVTGLIAVLLVTLIAVAFVYLIRLGVRFRSLGSMPMVALRHISVLVSVVLLVVAFRYVLNTYELVYSARGVVNGPGFTDVRIVRPLNWLMAGISVIVAVGLLSGYVLRNIRPLVALLGSWLVLAAIVTPGLPLLVQRYIVDPNELSRERPYIQDNIAMTRAGFGLDGVQIQDLTGQERVATEDLTVDQPPLNNVRIWDYRVVGPIYQQLQSFVPFYAFPDIDIDRYPVDGQTVQVLVGVRELNLDGLSPERRGWVNTHLVYTHGYGVVMSPVSEVAPNDWPVMLMGGIPVTAPQEIPLDRPEIYFGQTDMQWIVLNTDVQETNGIVESGSGDARSVEFEGNAYGSVGIGNLFTRSMAALTLGDRNVLVSSQLTGDSRVVLHRNVIDRAETIAPFLDYDNDPYAVVANGRVYWVVDAYTMTDRFPHATRYDGENYRRNSVKVVVDAYSGETTFYRTDVDDPIADAWSRVYRDLFTPVSEAPPELSAHFRYPEDLFTRQSQVWSEYHMDDADTWYYGDNKWAVATDSSSESQQPMDPYFVNRRLPGSDEDVFALTIPFTPGGNQNRQNMTAWFAGTSDAGGNLALALYRYPRQAIVYGPNQVEAQVDQDAEISQQITLWNQGGSRVIRGTMLVIPVNNAVMYVQPLYLQAAGSNASAPELAAVIVSANDQVVMRPTLGEAINALRDPNAESVSNVENAPSQSGNTQQPSSSNQQATPVPQGTSAVDRSGLPSDLAAMSDAELAEEAQATLNRMDEAVRTNDLQTYNEQYQRLQLILGALSGSPITPAATPAP